jgi:hypothetical protein
LYKKKDVVILKEIDPLIKKKKLKIGDVGIVCDIKFFEKDGWFYLVDFGHTFPLVKVNCVKRKELGWLRNLKLRLKTPENLEKSEKKESWTIESFD